MRTFIFFKKKRDGWSTLCSSPDLVDGSREAKNQNVFLLKVRRSSSKRKDKENGGSEGGKNGGHVSVNNIMNVAVVCSLTLYL